MNLQLEDGRRGAGGGERHGMVSGEGSESMELLVSSPSKFSRLLRTSKDQGALQSDAAWWDDKRPQPVDRLVYILAGI